MILTYKISEPDFLDFNLFTASQSETIAKKKQRSWVLMTVVSAIISYYCYSTGNLPLAYYFGAIAFACAIFYPTYFRWRYKRHYTNYIRQNYAKRFGQTEQIEITDGFLLTKDQVGESKIGLDGIEKVDETPDQFFIKLSIGQSLIIPKRDLQNIDDFISLMKSINVDVNDFKDWRW